MPKPDPCAAGSEPRVLPGSGDRTVPGINRGKGAQPGREPKRQRPAEHSRGLARTRPPEERPATSLCLIRGLSANQQPRLPPPTRICFQLVLKARAPNKSCAPVLLEEGGRRLAYLLPPAPPQSLGNRTEWAETQEVKISPRLLHPKLGAERHSVPRSAYHSGVWVAPGWSTASILLLSPPRSFAHHEAGSAPLSSEGDPISPARCISDDQHITLLNPCPAVQQRKCKS